MDGYIGREEELAYLNGLWEKAPMSCAVHGRRHLGKTALLKEFTKDKSHIYITGTQGLRSDNLEEINRALEKFSGKKDPISDIHELFPRIKKLCSKKKAVVIIDRLADLETNFLGMNVSIRNFMIRELNSTRAMLIVCDNDSSIFGRFYYTLELKPMSYLDCKGFHPDYTPLQQLKVFAMVGGTPAYHHLFGSQDPEDIILNQMFNHMSVFSLEAEGMVASESSNPDSCAKVLAAMAAGGETVREIASRADMANTFCSKVVDEMEHKGLLVKEDGAGLSRRATFTINNNILKFYYQVVYRHTHLVEFESPQQAYEQARDDIDEYMERGFKAICMDYAEQKLDARNIARVRKKDNSMDKNIDFAATIPINGKDRTVVAKCKLYGDPLTKEDMEALEEHAKKFDPKAVCFLFSGTGFSSDLKLKAGQSAITLDDLYEA